MSPSELVRQSSWAAAVAGVLFILAEILTPIKLLTHHETLSQLALTDRFVVQSLLTLFGAMLLLAGLVGLYTFQAREAGMLGAVGFATACFITAVMLGTKGAWRAASRSARARFCSSSPIP